MDNDCRAFVEQLFVDGHVRVQSESVASQADVDDAVDWILQTELVLREHLPHVPPTVGRCTLQWAISHFYRAAQLAVFRQLGPEEIDRSLSLEFVSEGDASAAAYSVDLVFRFLPDMYRIVKGMNPDDPLLLKLKEWGAQWPLSSVGIPDLVVTNIEPILSQPCLSQMYLDRIIEREATDRLSDPRLLKLVRGMIGAYPDLSPKLYRFVTSQTPNASGPLKHE